MPLSQLAILITIVFFGLPLIALIYWICRPTEAQRNKTIFKDSEDLNIALSLWEPVVVEIIETYRDVKKFANLARFVCALCENKNERIVHILVGLTALVAIGELKVSKQSINKFKTETFECFNPTLKHSIDDERKELILSQIKILQDALDDDSCEQFLKIAKFIEFS